MDENIELLTGWGGTAPTATRVAEPHSPGDVREAIAEAPDRGLVARGLARSYGDAAQNAGGVVLRMTELAAVHDVDIEGAGVTVDAGVSLEQLMRLLVPLGLFPMVTPGTCQVTVGGAIAADVHGKNHHGVGSFCNHVEAFTLETPQGTRHVTPDRDPDVFWATAGGMGLTGVVTQARLRMKRIRTSRIRMDTERASDLDDAMSRMEQRDSDYHYSVAWIDVMARGSHMGRSVITRGDFAEPDELPTRMRSDPLGFKPSTVLTAPPWFPNGLLNKVSVRAFNELWFRKAPRHQEGAIVPLASFHHPLDFVHGWNRIYGTRGFLQYQFVVPYGPEGEAAVRTAVERLSAHGAPSFRAVLKRFGPGNPGHLSFPMPGWTLTLDVPAGMPGLAGLCDGLDEVVLEAGGRLYLAKESRAKPWVIHPMYPRLDEWREIRAKLDPGGVLRSDMARRLDLC
ncbi:MAG: FAD-binding oxidoreductase [Acidimicrobiia bacterium]|nr:FAD-binding oxidoreductase [Acidimicrobiia bacterium]